VVVPGVWDGRGDGVIVSRAQLAFANGMVTLGSADNGGSYGRLMAQPDEISGRLTSSVCLVVSDADAVCATPKAAAAEVVSDVEDASYGGRGFSCLDMDGHLWWIRTYDAWETSA
jgi:uncharacterized glyoxalase superfamily protein PhnB